MSFQTVLSDAAGLDQVYCNPPYPLSIVTGLKLPGQPCVAIR